MRLLLPLVACVLATGCTAAERTPSAPTEALPPPRPREVRLDGVDPCTLLSPEQRAGLGLTSEPHASTAYVALFRGNVSSCTMSGPYPQAVLLGVSAVTTVGIERWQEHDVAVDVRPTTAGGFPAVVAQPRQFSDYCSIEVDVASGQLLEIQFGAGNPQASIAQDELCHRAGQAADEVATTLLSR